MKFYVCAVLTVWIATCSAGFITDDYGSGRRHGGGGGPYEVIQAHSGPALHQEVKTFQVIQQHDRDYGGIGGQRVQFVKVFYPQSQDNHVKYIQQRQPLEVKYVNLINEQHTEHVQEPAGNFKTIQVLHKHPAEHIKSIQIVHEQPIPHAGGYSDEGNFGDAFETLKSLKVYGAFEGNGAVVDSYGSPIVRTWNQI